MSYANYSQNDTRWKNSKLGSSSWTMGQAGCLVTSLAVIATNLGHTVTPAQMLALLEQHGLINGNGDLTRMDALSILYSDIKMNASKTWPKEKADLSFLGVNTIVEIDDSPAAGMQTHFMPVIKVTSSDVQVMDVWDGITRNVSAYGARWKPAVSAAAVIYGAWKYSKVTAPVKPATKPVVVPAKPVTPPAVNPLQTKLDAATKTIADQKATIGQLQASNKTLNGQLATADDDNADLKKTVDTLTTQATERNKVVANQQKQINDLKAQLSAHGDYSHITIKQAVRALISAFQAWIK